MADAEACAENDLRREYAKGHLALGLGAGVSQDSGLPGWNELVCRVAEALPDFGRPAAQELLNERFDATAVATILRSKAGTDEAFAKLVRDALYRDFGFPHALRMENYVQFAQHIRATNATLHAVGSMCGVRLIDGNFAPNPLIRTVITLNIDALLEMYTRARFAKRVLRTIERASASASARKIHSYHVHGYLVRDGTKSMGNRRRIEADDRLILTEQNYFDVVANANGFVNYTLLHALRQYRFLFVGMSMTDSNLRRALHLSFSERIRELRAEGDSEHIARNRATRHWAIMLARSPALDEATKTLLQVLGVTPIWVESWDKVPKLSRALYESTGRDWQDVA